MLYISPCTVVVLNWWLILKIFHQTKHDILSITFDHCVSGEWGFRAAFVVTYLLTHRDLIRKKSKHASIFTANVYSQNNAVELM